MNICGAWASSGLRRARALAGAVLLLAEFAGGQNPPQKPQVPTFRTQSNLVVVDVTVRDKKGELVRDLRKEDFTIYEDNVPQEIVNFSLEEIPVVPEQPGAADTAAGNSVVNFNTMLEPERKKAELKDKRLVILFFD